MIVIIPVLILAGFLAWKFRPSKKMNLQSKLALWLSIAFPSIIAIASIIFEIVYIRSGNTGAPQIVNFALAVMAGMITAGISLSAIFAIARKKDISRGVVFGTCISVIVLIITFGVLESLAGV